MWQDQGLLAWTVVEYISWPGGEILPWMVPDLWQVIHNLTIAVDRQDNKVHVPLYPSEIPSSLSKSLQRYHLWDLIPFRHTPSRVWCLKTCQKSLVYLIVHASPKRTWFQRKSPDWLNPEPYLYPNWNLIYLVFVGLCVHFRKIVVNIIPIFWRKPNRSLNIAVKTIKSIASCYFFWPESNKG